MDEEFYNNFENHTNNYIPIYDLNSLIYNLNRSGWITTYDLILPIWNEIISTGNMQLIENNTIKDEIVMLHFLATEIKELESKIMTPVVKNYKTIRADYYDVSKSNSSPIKDDEKGLFSDNDRVDMHAIRTT